ncbi:phage portal protein [Acetobacter pasteurianus]|uniref:Phage portal protein n=1 Tax=Acetobacter pasteurianus subsp. pasteurianus TaxID=481145 RepID=A0A1Y0Y2V1_ACEPA|nr:phage portal protein [Acetobacter pasteurianus]ARW49520.1 hypothetical protein S1001342_03230 [Acetobacter pasteurianus subsp. pasteurianus]
MNLIKSYFSNKPSTKKSYQPTITEAPILNTFPWSNIGATSSGVAVTPRTSLQHSAVYACVRTITADIAKIPLRLEKYVDGGWVPDKSNPKGHLIDNPNDRMVGYELIEAIVFSVLTSGDSFTVVIRDKDKNPIKLIPCRPYSVSVIEDPDDAELYYRVNEPLLRKYKTSISSETGDTRVIYHDDMIRTRNLSFDNGVYGTSLIQIAQEAFGLSLATQEAAARAFQNGSHINGFFKLDGGVGKETINKNFNALQREIAGITNSGTTPILTGLDWVNMDANVSELQLVESRRESTLEIARMYRVPAYKLSLADTEKAANISEQEQSYITNTLIQYTRPLEQHMDRVLLNDKEKGFYRYRFDFTKQAEPNEQVRSQFYQSAITMGWMNVNEVRQREDLAPIPDGNNYLQPMNTGVIGEQHAQPIKGDGE